MTSLDSHNLLEKVKLLESMLIYKDIEIDKLKNQLISLTTEKKKNFNEIKPKKCTIFILESKCNKFFIGISFTGRLYKDYYQKGNGSEWNDIYPPDRIVSMIDNKSVTDVDKYTLLYMKNKGIENVRGGSFSNFRLSEVQLSYIENCIKNANF